MAVPRAAGVGPKAVGYYLTIGTTLTGSGVPRTKGGA